METSQSEPSSRWRQHAWSQRTTEWLAAQITHANFVQLHSTIGEALHGPEAEDLAEEGWWVGLVQASPATRLDIPPPPPGVSETTHLIYSLRDSFHKSNEHDIRLSSLAAVMARAAPITEGDWATGYVTDLNQPIAARDLDVTQISPDTWEALVSISANPHLARLDIPAYPGSLLTPYRLVATEALKANLGSDYQSSIAVNLASNRGVSSEDLTWYMDLLEQEVPRRQGEFESAEGYGPFLSKILSAFNSNPSYVPHYAVESVRETEPWVLEAVSTDAVWKAAIARRLQSRNQVGGIAANLSFQEALRDIPLERLVKSVRGAMKTAQDDPEAASHMGFAAKFSPLIGLVFVELEEELGLEPGAVPTTWLSELL